MGLFDDIFGSSSKSSSNSNTKGSSTTRNNQTTTTTEKGGSTSTTQGETTTLDPATIALLQSLTSKFAGQLDNTGTDAASLRNVAQQLTTNANDTKALDASILTGQNEAERQFQLNEGKQISGLQDQIGSKGNTFSQLLEQSGSSDLQTQLQNILATTKVQEQANKTSGLSAAAGVYSQASQVGIDEANAPEQRLLSIISALKGAQTDTNSTTDTTNFENILSQLNGTSTTDSNSTTNQTGQQSSNPGVIGGLSGLFNLFGG